MSTFDPPGQASGSQQGEYRDFSYVSISYPQSSPPRVAGLAHLFGLAPAPVETARVLELGCSSGGNILPLAARFPKMRVLGVDLAPRHIKEGQARIKSLGLTNAELRVEDIGELDLKGEYFDYIVCHGVYSWVPPHVRDAILRIVGQHLSPQGVGYVSYNVYPGWHLRNTVRDLMLFLAGPDHSAPAVDRIGKARWVLENVPKITNPGSPYGAKLREEAVQLAKLGDHYIYGEFLAHHNAPCYFHEFYAAAQRHGVQYLCDTDIASCIPEAYGPEIAEIIRIMAAHNGLPGIDQMVAMEQATDFLSGRAFRQSLLVRQDQAKVIQRQVAQDRIRGLHLVGKLVVDRKASSATKFAYQTIRQTTLTTTSTGMRRALDLLAAAWPETRTMEELLSEMAASGIVITDKIKADLEQTLFNVTMGGALVPTTAPVRIGKADDRFPIARRDARLDAHERRPAAPNADHEAITLDGMAMFLLPLLDGTRERRQLIEEFMAAVASGGAKVADEKTGKPLTGKLLETAIERHVDQAIAGIARAGLLYPSPDAQDADAAGAT